MISISLSVAIGLYVTLLLGITLLYWIYTVKKENQEYEDHSYGEPTVQCPICKNMFASLPQKGIIECPQCGSLFEFNEEKQTK